MPASDALPVAQSWPRLCTSIVKRAIALDAGELGDLAVIDRLDEARLDHAALEERAAPFRDRQVDHIGHHVDAGDEPAAKTRSAARRCRRGSCSRTVSTCCRPGHGRFRAGWSYARFPLILLSFLASNGTPEWTVASVFRRRFARILVFDGVHAACRASPSNPMHVPDLNPPPASMSTPTPARSRTRSIASPAGMACRSAWSRGISSACRRIR